MFGSLLPDPPEWPSSMARQQRDHFYGFISGIANLTCEAIAEPPAEFTWFRVPNQLTKQQRRSRRDDQDQRRYELITNKTDPELQVVNEQYKSTLMVRIANDSI